MSDSPQDALGSKILIEWERGEYDRAMELLSEQERAYRDVEISKAWPCR